MLAMIPVVDTLPLVTRQIKSTSHRTMATAVAVPRGLDYRTSTGVGHRHIPEPCLQEMYRDSSGNIPRQITRFTQLERWWSGGAVLGPSEYGAHFTTQPGTQPRPDVGATMRLNPVLLRPPTLEHFASAGYSRRVRSHASAIFPGRMEPWQSETTRAFTPISERHVAPGGFASKDQLTIWDADMYPRAWGFGRQESWICPPYMRQNPLRDVLTFSSHTQPRNVPTYVHRAPHRGMQSESQAAYQGAPALYQGPTSVRFSSADVISKLGPHEALLAPDMYTPESNMYGSGRPTTAWV